MHDEAGKADPRYAGFDGARARFLRFFPGGFQSEAYLDMERNYKLVAKEKLDRDAPLAQALNGTGFGEAALAAYRGTNLLSRFEKTRLQALLRGPESDLFVRAAARFTEGDRSALLDMQSALKPHDNAKWTVVTYLPFLWRPDVHMILKPQSTTDFAARVGHRFAHDYEARLEIGIYDGLLDLASLTERELADLQPTRPDRRPELHLGGRQLQGRGSSQTGPRRRAVTTRSARPVETDPPRPSRTGPVS